jgi:nucleotide-binding universal stress UspA family protein
MARVVVGVSASSGSPSALVAAAAEARMRSAELVAVQAWRPPRPPASPGGRPPGVSRDTEASMAAAKQRLRIQVARALGIDAPVSLKVVQGGPRAVLQAESEHADLLVLDSSRTPTSQPPQRLVSRLLAVVRCPVLVMPPTGRRPATSEPSSPVAEPDDS